MIETPIPLEADVLDRDLLTPEQVAEYLQVHVETVRRWLRSGELRGVNLGGRARWRVRREDLQRFVDAQSNTADET
jgi:excisionase family DNA binding protein